VFGGVGPADFLLGDDAALEGGFGGAVDGTPAPSPRPRLKSCPRARYRPRRALPCRPQGPRARSRRHRCPSRGRSNPRRRDRTRCRHTGRRRGSRPFPSRHRRSTSSGRRPRRWGRGARRQGRKPPPRAPAARAANIAGWCASKASRMARTEKRKMPLFHRCRLPSSIACAVAASGFSTKRRRGSGAGGTVRSGCSSSSSQA
jgi:hypothetical protein